MGNNKKWVLLIVVYVFLYTHTTYAIVGIGFHWGNDMSLSMGEKTGQPVTFLNSEIIPKTFIDSIKDLASKLPIGITVDSLNKLIDKNMQVIQASSPILLSRTGWERTYMNFGAKVYLDIIPFIDAIELSTNFGAWQYLGSITYPNGQFAKDQFTVDDINNFMATGNYGIFLKTTTYDLTLEKIKLDYLDFLGIKKTPFTKLHFDLTVRKTLLGLPPVVNIVKLYAGGGPSLHFATPIITPQFIRNSIASAIKTANNDLTKLATLTITDALMKEVLNKLLEEQKKPVFGMHLLAGFMVKFPVIPIGIYADGKLQIPFAEIVKDADLSGFGAMLNTGIVFGF